MSSKPEWAVEYEDEARFDNLRPLLLRKRVRYQLSRLKTEADGGPKAKPPKGFKKHYSKQEWFDGWSNWGDTWDVGTPLIGEEFQNVDSTSEDPLEAVPRYITIGEQHEARMEQHFRSDEIGTRRRKRADKMDAINGNKDNV